MILEEPKEASRGWYVCAGGSRYLRPDLTVLCGTGYSDGVNVGFWGTYELALKAKQDYERKNKIMEKKDLKNGMLMVFTKNSTGGEYRTLVMDNELLFVGNNGGGSYSKVQLSNDCKSLNGYYTLVKILEPKTPSGNNIGIDFAEFIQCDQYWETVYMVEEPVVEMTMAELCKALGKNIKIVKD